MSTFVVTDYRLLIEPDGQGFDAQQLRSVEVVVVDGDYNLYYSGLGGGNQQDLGLAQSSDGVTFDYFSTNQLLDSEPSIASFRFLPKTILYEDGEYRMWYFGNDRNSNSDPSITRGIGYATSTDGINWDFDYPVIRSETGSWQGYTLLEVVKLEDQYLAYGFELNGPSTDDYRFFVMTSDDGITFDTEIDVAMDNQGYLSAATVHEGVILSLWKPGFNVASGDYEIMVSRDGINFESMGMLDLPFGADVGTLRVVGDTVEIYGNLVDTIDTDSGSFLGRPAVVFEVDLSLFGTFDDPVIYGGGNGDEEIIGLSNDDALAGGKGNDVISGNGGDDQIDGGQGADTANGGTGDDVILGGKGDDSLNGGEGSDHLSGGKGADTLAGGPGDDILSGGSGADLFVFAFVPGEEGHDQITDFGAGPDVMQIANVAFDDLTLFQSGTDAVVAFGFSGGDLSDAANYDYTITLAQTDVANIGPDDFDFV